MPRAIVQRDVGWTLGRLQRVEGSIEHLANAVLVLEASDDRRNASLALDMLGMMLERVRRSDEAIERLERSLIIALELGDLKSEFVRMHLGTTLTRAGQPLRARPHLERSLEIAHQMGDRYLESVAAWAAAEMEDALGSYAAAKEMRRRELALLLSIGGNPHNEALSHAHLAHLARLTGDGAAAAAEAAEARRLAAASPHAGLRGPDRGGADRGTVGGPGDRVKRKASATGNGRGTGARRDSRKVRGRRPSARRGRSWS